MTPQRLEDIESLRGMLVAVERDLTTIGDEEKNVHREISIARIHASQAVKALNFFLRDKPATYAEEAVTPREAVAFLEELNSGTDS